MKTNEDTRPFKLQERNKARCEWQMYFPNIMFGDVVDNLLSVLRVEVVIDIVKLDERLKNLYPEEWDYRSMMEIIETHYGTNAVRFIESLI